MTRRAWIAFAVVSLLWGIPYLFIKLAVDEVSPSFLAFVRVALGAALLAPIAWRRGALRGLGARWKPRLAFAAFEITLPFPLIGFGEQRVSSSLAAILVATLPLIVAVAAVRTGADSVDGWRVAGLLVGFTGVIALLGFDVAGSSAELLGAGAILLATCGYAGGPLIVNRWLADVDPLGPVTAALALAALLLAPAAFATAPAEKPSGEALMSMAVLGIACSALAFLFMFALIAEAGPARASVITYVNPVVAVVLGVVLLGEDVTAGAVAGLLLILAGSWLATGGGPPGRPRVVVSTTPPSATVPPTQVSKLGSSPSQIQPTPVATSGTA
jgi:drug/metabolite transporter (DMT)-like permease